jgi:hypothetical protein
MRIAAFAGAVLALATAAPAQAQPAGNDLAWLAGCWSGENGGERFEERWMAASADLLLGTSHTVRGERVVAFEFLRIEKRGDERVYVAQPGGRTPTEFVASRPGAERAIVFANPSHDFPKRVGYESDRNDRLTAWIDGGAGTKRIVYAMQRVRCEADGAVPATKSPYAATRDAVDSLAAAMRATSVAR